MENNRCGQGGTGTFPHCWWECKMGSHCGKQVLQFLKRLNTELPYDPAVLLLGTYPKELKIDI